MTVQSLERTEVGRANFLQRLTLTPAYGMVSDPCPDREPQDLNERFSTLLEAAGRKLDAHPLEHRGQLTLAFLRAGKLPVQLYYAGAC